MLKVYRIVLNILIFFFVWAIFEKSILIGGGQFVDKLGAALVFGLITAFVPNILKFFKLPVNTGSTFLITLILTFLYLFIQLSVFNTMNLTGQSVNLGIDLIGQIQIQDKTNALVLLSLLLSSLSVGIDFLKKK
jgi:hypothetical protein